MKTPLACLVVLALTTAGCVDNVPFPLVSNTPTPTPTVTALPREAAAPVAKPVATVAPVLADEVTETNAKDVAGRLLDELDRESQIKPAVVSRAP